MESKEKYDSILKYLSKNYIVKDKVFWCVYDPHEEKCGSILNSLVPIFSFSKPLCEYSLKKWYFKSGLNEKDWEDVKLKGLVFTWSPEMAQDLRGYHGIDAEAELTALLSEEIGREIDRPIINQLFELANER